MNFPSFAFFGSPEPAVTFLSVLEEHGFIPSLIVTKPDAPVGRKQILTPPPVKVWALERNIPVLQPEKLDESFISSLPTPYPSLFIVFAYGKIIPGAVLDIPKHGTLNYHPSLLPKHRGASPIQSAILHDEKNNGITMMLMDAKMDHGPILAQKKYNIPNWPPKASWLLDFYAREGGQLFAENLPKWIVGELVPLEQNHEEATFCKLIKKEDAEINLEDDAYTNYLKIQAYDEWPRTFFFKDGKRFVITEAEFADGKLTIKRVIPEGKKEMKYSA